MVEKVQNQILVPFVRRSTDRFEGKRNFRSRQILFSVIFSLFVVFGFESPQTAQAQTSPCSLERGTVTDRFTPDESGSDFRLKCTGDLSTNDPATSNIVRSVPELFTSTPNLFTQLSGTTGTLWINLNDLDTDDDGNEIVDLAVDWEERTLGQVILFGSLDISDSSDGRGVKFTQEDTTTGDVNIDSRATIKTASDEATALEVNSARADSDVRVRNFETLQATGTNGVGMKVSSTGATADVEVVNNGNISGTNTGISASATDNGNLRIRVNSGFVTAGTADEQTAEQAILGTINLGSGVTNESDTDTDIQIEIFGNSRVVAHDGSSATAIQVNSGSSDKSTLHSKVLIRNQANVSAEDGTAVAFDHKGTLEIVGSGPQGVSVVGSINFGTGAFDDVFKIGRGKVMSETVNFNDGNDLLEFTNWGSIDGTINFGAGSDELVVESPRPVRVEVINGLETIRINRGTLVIAGSVDLSDGTVEIHDAGRLAFEIGNVVADQGAVGSLTAGELKYDGSQLAVYVQLNADLNETQISAVREYLADNYPIGSTGAAPILLTVMPQVTQNGEDVDDQTIVVNTVSDSSSVVKVGELTLSDGSVRFIADQVNSIGKVDISAPDTSGSSHSGTSSERGLLGIGLLALAFASLDFLFEPEVQYGSYFGNSPNERFFVRPAESKFNSYGSSYFDAVGHQVGWNLLGSDGKYLNAGLAANSTVDAGGRYGSAKGNTVFLSAGTNFGKQFMSYGLTHGEYDAQSRYFSGTTKGWYFGDSAFTHTQAKITAGQHWSFGGMDFTNTASLFSAKLEQSAYEAEGTWMTADIAKFKQRYSGMKLGIRMDSSKWFELSESAMIKPRMKFSAIKTDASRSNLMSIRESDKAGVLSFTNPSLTEGLPGSVNVFNLGMDMKVAGNSRGTLQFGYAGMEVDGEYEQAAVAAYRMRF